MLEPRRLQMLAAMGLTTWQLRKPDCLPWQGGDPAIDASAYPEATTSAPTAVLAQPCLGVEGAAPAWLADLQQLLAGVGVRVDSGAPQPGWGRLLMQPPSRDSAPWPGVDLPGYAGKRAVWQALCASGWLHD